MTDMVSINNTKENTLEFDLSLQGISPADMEVRFVVEAVGMEIAFKCVKQENGKWKVDLPILPILEKTMYQFHFSIIADGYYFEPLRGSINVVGSAELYVSQPKNIKALPTEPVEEITDEKKDEEAKKEAKKEEEKEEKKVEKEEKEEKEEKKDKKEESFVPHTKPREKSIEQIATELMEQAEKAVKPAKVKQPVAEQPVTKQSEPEQVVITEEKIAPVEPPPAKKTKDQVAREILEQAGYPVKKKRKFTIR